MTYDSFSFHGFGKGLNLRDKPDAVDPAECIDAMNVVFSDRGAIQQRDGYGTSGATLTNRPESLEAFYTSGGTKQLLAGCGTRLEALSNSFEVVASATGLSAGVWDFVRFGKPNAEVAYAGNGANTLRKWDGSEWSAPTAEVDEEAGKAMPKGKYLAAWPGGGNRLIVANTPSTGGPNGTTSSVSHVWFSETGDPEAYESTAFVQLSPGDGEEIQAVVPWRETIIVFKETKFFVFYGVSGDNEGKPVFNFRAVEAGVGLASPRAVAIEETGIYFMNRHGVYVTTGQEPEELSHSKVEPIWSADTSEFYLGGVLAHGSIANCVMGAVNDVIYLAFPTEEANNRTLIYDYQSDWWSIADLPIGAMTSFRVGAREELVFALATGENKIARYSDAFTNDDGEPITSRWRSGWFDLDSPDVKTIRSSKMWGSGKVFCGLGHDFYQSPGTLDLCDFTDPTADTWGGTTWSGGEWAQAQELIPRQRRRAVRGTVFSMYFMNSVLDQSFSIHRVAHHVREARKPSTVKA